MSDLQVSALPPNDKLKGYVRRILITTGDEHTDEVIPIGPTGFSYFTYSRFPLELHYAHRIIRSKKQLYLAGQLNEEQPFFKVKGRFFHIGLELLPTAPHYFFGVRGEQLVDDGLEFEEVNPDLSKSITQALAEIDDAEAVGEYLQQQLVDQLPHLSTVDYLDEGLNIIYRSAGDIEVQDLIGRLNVSERQFRRQFKKVVGIGPKQYCKIIQLNTVFEAINLGEEQELYNLALKHGYYDHAHFINDFKTHFGKSPQQFLKSDHDFLKSYLGSVKA